MEAVQSIHRSGCHSGRPLLEVLTKYGEYMQLLSIELSGGEVEDRSACLPAVGQACLARFICIVGPIVANNRLHRH
jgi:hypothetical protein